MKHIEMKVVPLILNGETGKLDYREQIKSILQTPSNPQSGADYEEVRKSIRLLDILDKANGVLAIEDADHDYLKARIKGARYLVIDRVVLDFIEDVTNPQE